jgi:LPS-assembly protein
MRRATPTASTSSAKTKPGHRRHLQHLRRPDPDWYLKASTLRLDAGRDVGTAGKTIIYFKDVPILGTPGDVVLALGRAPLGLAAAPIGFGSKGKFEFMVPYYFNIAPNRDLTVFPRMMSTAACSWAPPAATSAKRRAAPTRRDPRRRPAQRPHHQDRPLAGQLDPQPDAGAGLDLRLEPARRVGRRIPERLFAQRRHQRRAPAGARAVSPSYGTQYWSLTARAQNYQVLQEPAAATNPALAIPRPYDRLPQINFHTGRYDVKGFDWAIDAERRASRTRPSTAATACWRCPQVSYPWVRPGYFITPKLMLHATKYNMETNATPAATSLTRTLPTFSVDSGMVFERDAKLFGSAVTQTLEPRLFYVRTPYKNQDEFPNVRHRRGRLQLRPAVQREPLHRRRPRLGREPADGRRGVALHRADGAERLRLAVGQRFYFTEPRVQLPGRVQDRQGRSDLLLAASGRIVDNWNFDSSVQYDATSTSVYSQNHGVRWTPGPMKVLNAEYRYVRDSFRNADVSAQWPLSMRWYGVGRVSYSLRDHKVLESLIGLEYKADCWIFRMGAQRFVTAAQNDLDADFLPARAQRPVAPRLRQSARIVYKSIPGYTRLNSNVGRPLSLDHGMIFDLNECFPDYAYYPFASP